MKVVTDAGLVRVPRNDVLIPPVRTMERVDEGVGSPLEQQILREVKAHAPIEDPSRNVLK